MRQLVLVGAGHTHVEVLRRFALDPPPDTRLTLVVDRPVAVYSGMVPGFVAGQYRAEDLGIDARGLAERAGARLVLAPAVGIDAHARRIAIDGHGPLAYDLASLDVGSGVAGSDLPGVAEHALATRPIGRFVGEVDALVRRCGPESRVVIVGAGAGGVELAFALRARTGSSVSLLDSAPSLLGDRPPALGRRAEAELRRVGVALRFGARVEAVERDALRLADGPPLACDAAVWVTGAAPHPWLRDAGLPTDAAGFLRIGPTLQVEGHPELFAAGDCASLVGHRLPKAGVYAVRAGPPLAANLARAARGEEPRPWRPQRRGLVLLNLADGRALGEKWGLVVRGRWVFRWKDWLDRRFVARYRA